MREFPMVKYPKIIIDSLEEYSNKYKFNTQEYKKFINDIEKIPRTILNKLEILNKGKTNLEKGSVVIIKVPTTKGESARAYVALTGAPIMEGKVGKVPMLDLHSLNIVEETPLESIKNLPTSDNKRENDATTQGAFFISEDFLTRKKEEESKEIEIYDIPKKETKKKPAPKKEEKKEPIKKITKKKPKKDEEVIEIPGAEEIKKSRQKILETAKRIKKDKEEERKKEENRKFEDAYKKMRFACVTAIHGMGYSRKESEGICDGMEEILQDHAESAIAKKTPTAIEEYVRLLTDKVIPARVGKPKKGGPVISEREEIPKTPIGETRYGDPLGLLEMACMWLMSKYNQSVDKSFTLCAERRGDITRLARAMNEGKINLTKATEELENIIIEKSQLTTVISGYKEEKGEEAKAQIKLAEEKRRKISAKAKEEAVSNAFMETTTKIGYAARSELQRRASEKLERMIGTSTREISVQLKGKAAIILEFQCYKSTGLDKTECFREYVSKIQDEYEFNLIEIPNGWAAHFQANVLPDGNIVMVHYGKEYRNFLGMVDKIKDEYEKPQHVLVWVNSFVDKSEYNRIL